MSGINLPSGFSAVVVRRDGRVWLACEPCPEGGAHQPLLVASGFRSLSAAIAELLGGSGGGGEIEPIQLTYGQAEEALRWRAPPGAVGAGGMWGGTGRKGGPGERDGEPTKTFALAEFEGAPWLRRGSGPPANSEGLWLLKFSGTGRAGVERSGVLTVREGGVSSPVGFRTPELARAFARESMPRGTLLANFRDSARPVKSASFDIASLPAVVSKNDYILEWKLGDSEYCIVEIT